MSRVLIVEDENSIVEVLVYNLRKQGDEPLVARDGLSAVQLARDQKPDLILLDIMLPGLDGFEVFRRVRAERAVPVIFLTARDEEIDRVLGLEMGGDDYVVKPFSVRELMARVKIVLRRQQPPAASAGTIRAGQLALNTVSREARWGNVRIELTGIQFELLRMLVEQPNRVFERETLIQNAWGYEAAGDIRAVDSMMKRLRARLREAGASPDCIVTVRDMGYKWDG